MKVTIVDILVRDEVYYTGVSLFIVLNLIANIACEEAIGDPDIFPGLSREVEILRDNMGIAHIYASIDADALYASGYIQATDRLFQLDLHRRQALGRQSEVLGESKVSEDKLIRMMNLPHWGRESAQYIKTEYPKDYALIVAWTAGVNRRIQEVLDGEAPLPYGFGPNELSYLPEKWDNADCFIMAHLLLFSTSNQLNFDLLASVFTKYFSKVAKTILVIQPLFNNFVLPLEERPAAIFSQSRLLSPISQPSLPPSQDLGERLREVFTMLRSVQGEGSNNWAVDGRYTKNKKPLIAGDPHLPLRSPSLFWGQHIISSANGKDGLDVAGFSYVGLPTIHIGHNNHVAWTVTNAYPDVIDLWNVQVNGDQVHLGQRVYPITRREETLLVKDSPEVIFDVEEVADQGVLLPFDIFPLPLVSGDRRILMNWVGFRASRTVHAFINFQRARSLDEFDRAVDEIDLAAFNFIAADAKNISYRVKTLVPDRGGSFRQKPPSEMMDGDDPEVFWTGEYLSDQQLPRSRVIQRGWISSSNNDPFGFTANGRIDDDPWYYGTYFEPGGRGKRIEEELTRLAQKGDMTIEDMKELQLDTHSVLADLLIPIVREVYSLVPTDESLAEFRNHPTLDRTVKLLDSEWDRKMSRDSAGAVVFNAFTYFLTEQVIGDDLGILFFSLLDYDPIYIIKMACLAVTFGYPQSDMLLQGGRNLLVMQALSKTEKWLLQRFGSVEPASYSWKDVHGTRFINTFGGELDGGFVLTDGSDGTVNLSSASFFDSKGQPKERIESGAGPVCRFVATFDEQGVPKAQVNFPRGNSGDPESPFWQNTLYDWVEGRYRSLLFFRGDVEADMADSIVVRPK